MHRPSLPVRGEVESRADMREAGLNAITFADKRRMRPIVSSVMSKTCTLWTSPGLRLKSVFR